MLDNVLNIRNNVATMLQRYVALKIIVVNQIVSCNITLKIASSTVIFASVSYSEFGYDVN